MHVKSDLYFSTQCFCKFFSARDGGNTTFSAASSLKYQVKNESVEIHFISRVRRKELYGTATLGAGQPGGEKGSSSRGARLPGVPPQEHQFHGQI